MLICHKAKRKKANEQTKDVPNAKLDTTLYTNIFNSRILPV